MKDVCRLEQAELMTKHLFYRTFMEFPLQYEQFKKVLGYEPPDHQDAIRRQEKLAAPPSYYASAPSKQI